MIRKVPTYCYQCVCGPDLLKVVVKDGVPIAVEPNFDAKDFHPAEGRVCVKAYGLIQKTYNPHRVKGPLRRTNPRKGLDQDPGWERISWDEALDFLAERLRMVRGKGLLDEEGYPRLAITLGGAGTPHAYMGSFNAFMAAWGPIDFSFGSGQGIKCYHTEHLFGEYWHRAFIVAADIPRCRLVISFGHNANAADGVSGVWRKSNARARGLKWIQVEPHLSVTAATADEWIPIRPKTDAAFLYGMLHTVLHEMNWRNVCDVEFLKWMTASPYLVGPRGYYLRDPGSGKPLIWDEVDGRAKPFDDKGLISPALEGKYVVENAVEVGPDGETTLYENIEAKPSFSIVREETKEYSADWASKICDVSASSIRRLAKEFVETASVGSVTTVEGVEMPWRPVAILLGKTVANGWGAYQAVWARTFLQSLVGGLEVPGSILGVTIRLNRPHYDRWASVRVGEDGFMAQLLNPTSRNTWTAKPHVRNAYKTLSPLVLDSSWSNALGATHLAWLFLLERPRNWPAVTYPDVWIVYRANPMVSHWDPDTLAKAISGFPFMVSFGYTLDETSWFADLILPESTDLESLQLYRIGGTSYQDQFWEYVGVALRQPVVKPVYDTMDMTDIVTELSDRVGLLREYNTAINNGALGFRLKTPLYDYSLDPERKYRSEEIWDRVCRAATMTLSNGREEHGLDWFREHGFYVVKVSKLTWYLHPIMRAKKLRYELPYQERVMRVGQELGRRLHEKGIDWWDEQLKEYEAVPKWHDFPKIWEKLIENAGKNPEEYPFWLTTARSMQFAWGANVSVPLLGDVAKLLKEHRGLVMNTETGRRMGLKDGDEVWVESAYGRVKARVVLRPGIRPDTLLAVQQFGHWLMPVAKDYGLPNMNRLVPLSLTTTDGTGSGSDVIRVKVAKAR